MSVILKYEVKSSKLFLKNSRNHRMSFHLSNRLDRTLSESPSYLTAHNLPSLVNEFGLYYDADTTSAYYNEYPICGYRPDRYSFGTSDWSAKSLIIFENYTETLNEYGH